MGTEGPSSIRTGTGPPHQEGNYSKQKVLLSWVPCPRMAGQTSQSRLQRLGKAGPQRKWSAREWPNDSMGPGDWVWSVVHSSASTCVRRKKKPETEGRHMPEEETLGRV